MEDIDLIWSTGNACLETDDHSIRDCGRGRRSRKSLKRRKSNEGEQSSRRLHVDEVFGLWKHGKRHKDKSPFKTDKT